MTGLRTRSEDLPNDRTRKLNDDIDSKIVSVEESLEEMDEYINSVVEVISARMVESTDVAHALALARFLDQKLELNKRKTDLIKLRISDKAAELAAQKKPTLQTSSIEDLIAGVNSAAAQGAAVGAAYGGAAGAAKAVKELPPPDPEVILIDTANLPIESITTSPAADDTESLVDELVTLQRPDK